MSDELKPKEIARHYIKFGDSADVKLAQAYLDLLKSQDGMVLVPVEPDDAWCRAFESMTNKRWPISSLQGEIKAAIHSYIKSREIIKRQAMIGKTND